MVFQDPTGALNAAPDDLRGGRRGPAHPEGRRATRRQLVAAALARAGLRPPERFFGRYPYEISGGQRQRVVIAGAMVLEPELLVADEPVSSLDASVRGEILALMLGLVRETGVAILVVTHDLGLAWNIADRVAVMYLGRIVEQGTTEELLAAPRHPYTRALLSVVPEARHVEPQILAGEAPDPTRIPAGCRFHPRCPLVASGEAARLGIEERCRGEDLGARAGAGRAPTVLVGVPRGGRRRGAGVTADAAVPLVHRPRGARRRARAAVRAGVAVRRAPRARRRAGLVLHLPRRRRAGRRRARSRRRAARARQRLPPPRRRGRVGRRALHDAAVPLPRLDVRARRRAARGAARRTTSTAPRSACGRRRSTRGGRSSSSTPTPAPPPLADTLGALPDSWRDGGLDVDALAFHHRSSTRCRPTGRCASRTSSSATTAPSPTRASADVIDVDARRLPPRAPPDLRQPLAHVRERPRDARYDAAGSTASSTWCGRR